MTLQDVINLSRRRLGNYELPYWWLDQELVDYASYAIYQIARDAFYIDDSYTTAVCNIALTAGVQDYLLSTSIVEIKSARVSNATDTFSDMNTTSVKELARYNPEWRDTIATLRNTPENYLIDYRTGYISVYPIPDTAYTLNMSVSRYPIATFSTISMSSQQIELPIQFQMILIDGILYQAYNKTGPETYNEKKADRHYGIFMKSINEFHRYLTLSRTGRDPLTPHYGAI